MSVSQPSIPQVWQAIELFLREAYNGQPPPAAVRCRLQRLHDTPLEEFFACGVFEHQSPHRYALRLGNQFYPHMKMSITVAPDGRGFLYQADTHDAHCRPADNSTEHQAYLELCRMNLAIAQRIEGAWDQQQIPTLKSFLRQDLARRGISASVPPR